MTTTTLQKLANISSYNFDEKEKFRKNAMKFLRDLVKELKLQKGDYSIRFNAGGIAVCGDPILHHNKFYINLHPLFGSNNECGYWRTCNGQTDYTGGYNRTINLGLTVKDFAEQIKDIL